MSPRAMVRRDRRTLARALPSLALILASFCATGPAHAWDSVCYHADGASQCVGGPDAARNRWIGPGDEHRQLWLESARDLNLPGHVEGPVTLDVFRNVSSDPDSLVPSPFAQANARTSRTYTIAEMAQLPDFSYSLWDWVTGNEVCPIDGASGASVSDPVTCHAFASHMGALNSSHFLPQAGRFFHFYHDIALARARACKGLRDRLPQAFSQYVEQCDQEAFTFEAVGQHYLQDAFSIGHMWERWGSPDLDDFPDGDRARALLVALTSGLIHGARGVLQNLYPQFDWQDPLCAPLDPAADEHIRPDLWGGWPSKLGPPKYTSAVHALREGVGDLYLETAETKYRDQLDEFADCASASIAQVTLTAGIVVPGISSAPAPTDAGFDAACLSQRATNGSMYLAYGLDGEYAGIPVAHLRFAGLLGLLETAVVKGATDHGAGVTISDELNDEYRDDTDKIGHEIEMLAETKPDGVELASGNLPPLVGVSPNGDSSYDHRPLARYADPLPFTQPHFDGNGGSDDDVSSTNLARAYHRSHAEDWCEVMGERELQELRAATSLNGCEACEEFVARHIRIGKGVEDFDASVVPLCDYLVVSPAHVYAEAEDHNPVTAAHNYCCANDDDDSKGHGGAHGVIDGTGNGDTSNGMSNGGSDGMSNGGTLGNGGSGEDGSGNEAGDDDTGGNGGNGGSGGKGSGGKGSGGKGGSSSGGGGSGGSPSGGDGPTKPDLPFACAFNMEACAAYWAAADSDQNDLLASAEVTGDPHHRTFDGLNVSVQAVGEFVLLDDGHGVVVQARQAPLANSRTISVVTAVAAKLESSRIAIYANESTPVWINGVPTPIDESLQLPDGASITHTRQAYSLHWASGERLSVFIVNGRMDVIFFKTSDTARGFHGILGSDDGTPDDDLTLRNGTNLGLRLSKADFYGKYAASYRVTQAESLFDYAAGQSTTTFTDASFPDSILSTASLSASQYRNGFQACTADGITGAGVLDDCILDFAIIGDFSAVRGYEGAPPARRVVTLADYFNDFERDADGAWTPNTQSRADTNATLSSNGYAGPFANETATLSLAGLATHQTVNLSFDLYVLGDWNGQGLRVGVKNGAVLLDTTFSNGTAAQAFPDFVNVASHPARTGSVGSNGLLSVSGVETLYHLVFSFPETHSTLALEFKPSGLDSSTNARFALDNVQLLLGAPPGATEENIGGLTVLHGAPGAPSVIGCADGRREALFDVDRHPDVAGCMGTWTGTTSLRTPSTGAACGDGIGICAAPADACASGWHICGTSGLVDELRRISFDECHNAGSGRFVAAMSHCGSQASCDPATTPDANFACYPNGYCSEAVCCGSSCGYGTCRSGVWPSQTQIANGTDQGCGAIASQRAAGILCCVN